MLFPMKNSMASVPQVGSAHVKHHCQIATYESGRV